MRMLRLVVLIGVLLAGAACVKDPGPIPANMSRIKVVCKGLYLNSILVNVTETASGQLAGVTQELGCILYDVAYFDVPVPPNSYDVNVGGTPKYKTATFNGAGEQVTVRITAVLISYGADI